MDDEMKTLEDKVARMTREEACKRMNELKRFGEPAPADTAMENPDNLLLMGEYQLVREKCASATKAK